MSDIVDGTSVSTAISSATDQQAIESQLDIEEIESKKSDAESKISDAKSEVTDAEKKKAEIEDKLATPTPKDSGGGGKKGGGGSNAVDTSEKNKLQSDLQAQNSTIQTAASEVQAAHVNLSELESALSAVKIDKAPIQS